jgi:hypothetical protein
MNEELVFHPPRRWGLIFHALALLALLAGGAFGLWRISLAQPGLTFLLYLLLILGVILLVPLLLYRAYALQRAFYTLERDGIHLRWGLRGEDIPMDVVLWVGAAEDLGYALPRPILRWPGAVLGTRRLPDGKAAEFLAGRTKGLVVIITTRRAFVISPDDRVGFLKTFQRLSEFGSLSPILSHSMFPAFVLSRSWADRPARFLLLVSILLASGLFIWVSLAIPSHTQISLRLYPPDAPLELVPGVRLLLLPVLNTFIFVADLVLGLFFYRQKDSQPLTYLLWGSSALTSLLFMGAVFFILHAT